VPQQLVQLMLLVQRLQLLQLLLLLLQLLMLLCCRYIRSNFTARIHPLRMQLAFLSVVPSSLYQGEL
jgi:hypothetical protein